MNCFKKTGFALLSLLILSCGKMRNEDESNNELDSVQKTEIDNGNITTQKEDSIIETDSLNQNATKGSILGEAKFKKKNKNSAANQSNDSNTPNAETDVKSPTENTANTPIAAPKKDPAPSKYNIQKVLNKCEIGETLTQDELSKNLSIPKDAIKLVKSITKISNNEIDIKWNSTWFVEKVSDAKFKDGRLKAMVKNNVLYLSGGAIGIRYNKKMYTDLEVTGRNVHIPSVKGFYWRIGRD